MLDAFLSVASIALAVAFAWAAAQKIWRFSAWREALRGYGLPPGWEGAAATAVPAAELVVAGTLLFVPCGCFGDTKARDYRVMITRNILLGVLAGALLLLGEGGQATRSVGAADILPAALACVGVIACLAVLRSVSASLDRGRDR